MPSLNQFESSAAIAPWDKSIELEPCSPTQPGHKSATVTGMLSPLPENGNDFFRYTIELNNVRCTVMIFPQWEPLSQWSDPSATMKSEFWSTVPQAPVPPLGV